MKRLLALGFAVVLLGGGCDADPDSGTPGSADDSGAPDAKADAAGASPADRLRARLLRLSKSEDFLVGQQRFNLTGVKSNGTQWLGSAGSLDRSDARTAAGVHPAVIGVDAWDLAEKPASWSPTPAAHAAALRWTHDRGGVVTIEWHMRGCSADSFGGTGNESCLCRLANDDAFAAKWLDEGHLDRLAAAMKREGLDDIPVVFRPFHEMTGGWFWWGYTYWNCAERLPGSKITGNEAYRTVFRRVVRHLREDQGLSNLLIAYSPDKLWEGPGATDEERYLAGYPGDAYVDLLGIDLYYLVDQDLAALQERYAGWLRLVTRIARQKGKPVALTEVGHYGLVDAPDGKWFTRHLLPLVAGSPDIDVAYVLLWENRTSASTEFYVPYAGHAAVADFQAFVDDPRTLMLGEGK